jgi:hypothetical protein
VTKTTWSSNLTMPATFARLRAQRAALLAVNSKPTWGQCVGAVLEDRGTLAMQGCPRDLLGRRTLATATVRGRGG